MICSKCGGKAGVVDTVRHKSFSQVYRRRKCKDCGYLFYTTEIEATYDSAFQTLWSKNYRRHK